MTTKILPVYSNTPDPLLIAQAAASIRAGQLVVFPTETVYGLGANAHDPEAVQRIFEAKGRPSTDPIIVHIGALADLPAVATTIPRIATILTEHFWPGPLTLILARHAAIPPVVSAGRATVAVRMPGHPVAQALLRAAATPIAAPSANLFARTSPTTAQHVLHDLHGRVELVLDGGPTTVGLESTVLDLTGEEPAILRPGGVSLEELQAVVPNVQLAMQHVPVESTTEALAAPGMLSRHYAPHAELLLFSGPRAAVIAQMQAVAQRSIDADKRVGVLVPDEEQELFADSGAEIVSLGSRTDLAAIGRNLFAGMRTLDQAHVDVILVRGFEQRGMGLAIWDRLFRASEGRVIEVEE